MKFKDQFRFVRQNMKKNKTRLFMTILATAMGCAFLIVLASVGFGLKQSIVDRIVGDRLVTEITVHGKTDQEHSNMQPLNEKDLDYMKSLPNAKAVLYTNYVQQDLRPTLEGKAVNAMAYKQIDYEAEAKTGFKLSAGRMPENGKAEVIIGYHIRDNENVADEANLEGNTAGKQEPAQAKEWLGKKMELEVAYYEQMEKKTKKLEVTVVGVTSAPAREWQQDRSIYIGLDTLQHIEEMTNTQFGELPVPAGDVLTEEELASVPKLGETRAFMDVRLIADHAKHVKNISETIRDKGYINYSIANELEQVNMMFMIMTIGLIFVGTIAILIASIGIFNTMTMAVTERAQDIGIMKAIGAHPASIRKIFLLESSIIGILGAIVGTVVSYIISIVVNIGIPLLLQSLMNEKVPEDFYFSVIPPYLALLACAISLVVAIISGYRPAKRATKIDVLRALRRDM